MGRETIQADVDFAGCEMTTGLAPSLRDTRLPAIANCRLGESWQYRRSRFSDDSGCRGSRSDAGHRAAMGKGLGPFLHTRLLNAWLNDGPADSSGSQIAHRARFVRNAVDGVAELKRQEISSGKPGLMLKFSHIVKR